MRNKLYILKKHPYSQGHEQQCAYLNMGKILANAYVKDFENFVRESSFDSFSYFTQIVRDSILGDKTHLLISNFGILCEKSFSLDVAKLFLELAKDYQVFLLWTGKIENDSTLLWNVESPKNKIEFDQGVLEIIGEDNEIFGIN